jgi:hypothetical protein
MITIQEFVSKFDDFTKWPPTKQTDYLSYYLLEELGKPGVGGSDLQKAFQDTDIKPYKRVSAYLSESASDKKGKYVKAAGGGYRLTRDKYTEISAIVKKEPQKVAVSTYLTELVEKVGDGNEKSFLEEALNCYRIEAYRGFIIMVWIVTIDHLQMYIFANYLTEFNSALAKNPDKKVKKIVNYDAFSDLPENKFIELARSADVITNDVRKLLDEKLGTRNSAAHPSGIKISGHKATEFAIDVIDNVLLKYN